MEGRAVGALTPTVTPDDTTLGWVLTPGTWWSVVDTWVGADRVAQVGDYPLRVDWLALDQGPCALRQEDLRMYWDDCARLPCRRVGGAGPDRLRGLKSSRRTASGRSTAVRASTGTR